MKAKTHLSPLQLPLYWEAARPKTLIASMAPVFLALALSSFKSTFSILVAVSSLIFALLIQIATNYFNDAYDFKKGADTKERKGPRRLVSSGLISFQAMRNAATLCLVLASPFALILMYQGGLIISFLCLLAALLSFAYTAGPKPLAYLGLGDIAVWIFFGPFATGGVFFLVNGYLSPISIMIGIIPAALSCQLLAINNTRDYHEDKKANKKTLPVRFGPLFGKLQIVACSLSGAFVLIGLYFF